MPSKTPGEASYADILCFLFGFGNHGIRDHLIIAIHVSYEGIITKLRPPTSFEFGVSVLDLTDIHTLVRKMEKEKKITAAMTKNLISTRNFCIDSSKSKNGKAMENFQFGTSEDVKYEDISRILNGIIGQRSFSLVVHSDRKMFKFLEVMDKEPGKRGMHEFLGMLGLKSNSAYILDVQSVAKEIFGTKHNVAMDNLCQMLKLPSGNVGVAGNDANSLLRALLVLAHRSSFSGLGKKSDDIKGLRRILSYLIHGSKPRPEIGNASKEDQGPQENVGRKNVRKNKGKGRASAPHTNIGGQKTDKATAANGEKAEEDELPWEPSDKIFCDC